ncbi:uncharacterized protein ARMOST_04599 [Armillaria ostoyae]|uniref:Uncharacterized protein n=1 Tax=Armillaria ostoyae TaxID=47428 RepID=A0A284QXS7_ARMOS|nr:uncharacterized protein ARMOST_04599 [Armillaria ostoyae]
MPSQYLAYNQAPEHWCLWCGKLGHAIVVSEKVSAEGPINRRILYNG